MSVFATKDQLKSAVAEWTANATNTSGVHGHISAWDTSRVTDMSFLFCGLTGDSYYANLGCNIRNRQFNDDINQWNVGEVTSMYRMFDFADGFDQPLHSWNLSHVTITAEMFKTATSFNQELNTWDVSQVMSMEAMFIGATSFDQELNDWNVERVTQMGNIFLVHSALPRARRLLPLRSAHTAHTPCTWWARLLRASTTVTAVRHTAPLALASLPPSLHRDLTECGHVGLQQAPHARRIHRPRRQRTVEQLRRPVQQLGQLQLPSP